VTPEGAGAAVEVRPNCGPALHDRLCGFRPGTPVVLFDRAGRSETGSVSAVNGLIVQVDGGAIRGVVDTADGAAMTEVAIVVYSLGDDPVTRTPRLMGYDGRQSNQPLVDHVVAMAFEYFGEGQPPALLPGIDLAGESGPWTTYGPKPPPDGVDGPGGAWGPGGNCTFAQVDGGRVARLAPLGPPGALVPLDPAMLTDGPWCPAPADPDRFDADLLRIRRVRVTLRLQVGAASLRGAAGAWFLRGGSARAAGVLVPDQQIQFDVSPRNLGVEP
jgi:hypothetical protein